MITNRMDLEFHPLSSKKLKYKDHRIKVYHSRDPLEPPTRPRSGLGSDPGAYQASNPPELAAA